MSYVRQAEPAPAEDLSLELALLCDALDILRRGAFIFAVCEEGPLRERLMQHVREHLEAEGDRGLVEAELSPDQPDLAGQLGRQQLYELPGEGGESPVGLTAELVRDRSRPPVVFVHTRGLAGAGMRVADLPKDHPERVRVEQIRRALRALNFQRERLSRLNVPLVFWLSQNGLGQVMQHAADVFAARSGLFFFEAPVREPTAPPPMRAEVTVGLLDRFHRTLLPPEELRKRAALYERRLGRERAADEPHWPGIAFLCRDLANIHRELDDYERAGEFQDRAIEAYQEAIAEREQETGSRKQGAESKEQEWASLQGWLGNAYAGRIRGDRAANLQRAITCYHEALRFRTPEAAPLDHATTQNNLGTAYADLPTGDRAENLQQAITCYREALRFRTPEAAPLDYAMTQNNLGEVYRSLLTGDREANLERASACFDNALTVWTAEAFPHYHQIAARNLERALSAQRSAS